MNPNTSPISPKLANASKAAMPLAALALKLNISISSNDNDCGELPVDVYPTAKLVRILGI